MFLNFGRSTRERQCHLSGKRGRFRDRAGSAPLRLGENKSPAGLRDKPGSVRDKLLLTNRKERWNNPSGFDTGLCHAAALRGVWHLRAPAQEQVQLRRDRTGAQGDGAGRAGQGKSQQGESTPLLAAPAAAEMFLPRRPVSQGSWCQDLALKWKHAAVLHGRERIWAPQRAKLASLGGLSRTGAWVVLTRQFHTAISLLNM